MADLDNKARYESYGASASFQFSSSGNNSANASQTGQGQNAEGTQSGTTDASKSTTTYSRNYGVSLPQFGSAKGTTSSAIAEGSLEIRSGENVDVSRDTANANGSIGKIFDKGEVTRNAELSQTVGQVAFTAVGDLASKMQSKSNAEVAAAIQERSKYEEGSEEYAEADQRVTDALKSSESWADGGKYRVALHAAAGALVASAGGGSLASGAAVGAGNEMLVAELGDLTKDMPDSERRNLLKLASSVAGAAIASATGGSASDIGLGTNIAASATEYNYLSHDQIKEMRRQLSTCQKNGCSDKQLQDIIFQYVVTSAKSDVELKKCIVSNDAACINKHVENMKSVSTDDLMLLATLDNWTNNSSLTDLQYQDKIKASIAQGDKGAGNWGYLLAGVLYPVRTAAGVASIPINAVNEFKVLIKAAAGDESARAQAQQILSKQGINAVFPGSVAADVVRGYMEQLDAADAAEKRGDINQAAYIRTSVAIDIASLLVPVAGSVAGKADAVLNSSKGSIKPASSQALENTAKLGKAEEQTSVSTASRGVVSSSSSNSAERANTTQGAASAVENIPRQTNSSENIASGASSQGIGASESSGGTRSAGAAGSFDGAAGSTQNIGADVDVPEVAKKTGTYDNEVPLVNEGERTKVAQTEDQSPKPSSSENSSAGAQDTAKISKQEGGANKPVPNALSESDIGSEIGSGSEKTVFSLKNNDDIVVAVQNEGIESNIDQEILSLKEVKDLGIPVVKDYGKTFVNGKPAIVLDKISGGSSRDVYIEGFTGGNGEGLEVESSTVKAYLNEKSVDDLRQIKSILIEKDKSVSDLQFLIDKDGRVVVNDPMGVSNGVRRTNIQLIDKLIEIAKKNIKQGD